ncbi:IclR family transcriptional regulator [Mesorhizobium waimense]|uniref:IclR family transcriptional regulator n=1 Tax=Mesorhizobium waimense TaxID=1300307 RepID=A0A3A5KQ54_9HYPH|nr:IclR family transcriptional regulator [Mesorhizobium waimense]RJT35056.1 IclR family transcriptional regulator [Mesorhizobium waimense]
MPTIAASLETPADSEAVPRRSRTSGIDRALQILDYLQKHERPATAYEIARYIAAPLSTIYVIVDDLVEKEILDRQDGGLLWLGPRLYHYGLTYARTLDLLNVAVQEMHELALNSRETVQICGRDDDHMVVLAMEEGKDHFQVTSRVGTRSPLNWTASGRMLVGHLSEDERREIFARSATTSPTGRAETDKDVLARTAAAALEAGLSIQAGESDFSVACIAAPICDNQGACRATISIVVPDVKLQQKDPDLIALVKASARRIESRLGWRPRRA